MAAGLLLQYVLVALAVLASAAFIVRRQFPQAVRQARIACAVPMVREGRAAWLRRLGVWIAPRPRAGETACGGCDGCAS